MPPIAVFLKVTGDYIMTKMLNRPWAATGCPHGTSRAQRVLAYPSGTDTQERALCVGKGGVGQDH